MNTLVLSNRDLRMLVRRVGIDALMDEMIERLAVAFAKFEDSQIEIPARTGFYYDEPGTGLIEWMPLFERNEKVVIKIVGYHPDSPVSHRLPTILSTLTAYDTATGHLRALVDGTFLTAMRTGAASAVASRWLARPESRTMGLIGCGAQAVTQLHAVSRVFDLREALVHDIDPAVAASFAQRAGSVMPGSLAIRAVPLEELLAESDIVTVATSVGVGEGPVFAESETRPWLHINAVGSDLPGKTELPLSLLKKSFVCADNPEQAVKEGECQQLGSPDAATGLVEVARDPDTFAKVRQQRSVFDSTGWALEDQVAMDLVLEHAEELGIGESVPIECFSQDPRNPYEFLEESDSNGRAGRRQATRARR